MQQPLAGYQETDISYYLTLNATLAPSTTKFQMTASELVLMQVNVTVWLIPIS